MRGVWEVGGEEPCVWVRAGEGQGDGVSAGDGESALQGTLYISVSTTSWVREALWWGVGYDMILALDGDGEVGWGMWV